MTRVCPLFVTRCQASPASLSESLGLIKIICYPNRLDLAAVEMRTKSELSHYTHRQDHSSDGDSGQAQCFRKTAPKHPCI
jgi:hypothetical protein